MTTHDNLKKAGITPTIDAEKAYRLGCEDGYRLGVKDATGDQVELRVAKERAAWLERVLTEISLLAGRAR